MATQQEEKIILQSAELPKLSLRLQKQVSDFTTDTLHLEASGHTVEEAIYGLGFLLEEVKKLRGSEK